MFYQPHRLLQAVLASGVWASALALFLASIVQYAIPPNRLYWPMWWLAVLMALTVGYYQRKVAALG